MYWGIGPAKDKLQFWFAFGYWLVKTNSFWLVVWNMNFIFPYIGKNHPNWRTHIFQMGWNYGFHIFQRGRYTTFTRFIIHKTYTFFRCGVTHFSLSLANGSGLVSRVSKFGRWLWYMFSAARFTIGFKIGLNSLCFFVNQWDYSSYILITKVIYIYDYMYHYIIIPFITVKFFSCRWYPRTHLRKSFVEDVPRDSGDPPGGRHQSRPVGLDWINRWWCPSSESLSWCK